MKLNIPNVFHFQRRVNRKYKDVLFRFIFQDKKDLLSLYNAVNGTDYQNPEDLEINTLENVIYLRMKNDLSFLIRSSMNLYEHQSTWNPNMPLRGLLYFAELYEGYIKERNESLGGKRRILLPFPNYVVFYNGQEKEEDRMELRLSDAFETRKEGVEPALECCVTILNINKGHNRELMEKCRRLQEYAEFVQRIRENLKKGMILEDAVEEAMEYCLRHGVLGDVLRKCQMEVRNMLLEEYYSKRRYIRHIENEAREEGWERGRKEGIEQGIQEGIERGMKKGIEQGIQQGSFEVLAGLIKDGIISLEQAKERTKDKKEEFVLWYEEQKK